MAYAWIYIFILVILIFILPLYYSQKDTELESFRPKVQSILIQSGFPLVRYNLYPSVLHTYTLNKKSIYLVTSKDKKRFNSDTILFVLLHEIAHILSSEQHHTDLFIQIENKLHQTAVELGYLDLNRLDPSYPCFG